MKLKSASRTDIGKRRANNQDSFICNDKLKLYAVADGLGGHVGGEVASRLAVEALTQLFSLGKSSFDPSSYLTKAVQEANQRIFEKAEVTSSLRGMGTTLTALYFSYDTAYIAHVGDSRAYFIQDDMIWQLSEDHTLVSQQMVSGIEFPVKNIITRSVGYDREVEIDLYTKKLSSGDIYLLCSDGLHGYLKEEEMVSVIQSSFSLELAAGQLIQLANDRGGDDNITAVLTKVERL